MKQHLIVSVTRVHYIKNRGFKINSVFLKGITLKYLYMEHRMGKKMKWCYYVQ